MTAIPATLTADTDDQAIVLTLERMRVHEITSNEAEKDLLLFFDAEIERENRPQLATYLREISSKVQTGELETEDAASDIRTLMNYWLKESADLPELLSMGAD